MTFSAFNTIIRITKFSEVCNYHVRFLNMNGTTTNPDLTNVPEDVTAFIREQVKQSRENGINL